MVRLIQLTEVTRPSTTPLSSTLFDHATVKDIDSFGLRNNEGLWVSYNCLDTLTPTPICPDPVAEAGYKTFSHGGWQPAFEFAVHGGVQCAIIGLDRDDMAAEVERVFTLNEAKGVERGLLNYRFVSTDSDAAVQWDAPVDLTPASPIPLPVAVGLLEGYAAQVYAGVPTLHIPRAAVPILMGGGVIKEEGGKFFTKTGAKVAAGGGYDTDDLASGEWTLFATGEVYVERSRRLAMNEITIPGDGSGLGSDENGLEQNTAIALAERMFRVAVDCFTASVTATVWA